MKIQNIGNYQWIQSLYNGKTKGVDYKKLLQPVNAFSTVNAFDYETDACKVTISKEAKALFDTMDVE